MQQGLWRFSYANVVEIPIKFDGKSSEYGYYFEPQCHLINPLNIPEENWFDYQRAHWERSPEFRYGWLGPEAQWYVVPSCGHVCFAPDICNMEGITVQNSDPEYYGWVTLERRGWLHVDRSGLMFNGYGQYTSVTQAQLDWTWEYYRTEFAALQRRVEARKEYE